MISAAVLSFVAKALIPSSLFGKFVMVAVHVFALSESKMFSMEVLQQKFSSFSSNEMTFFLNKSSLCLVSVC